MQQGTENSSFRRLLGDDIVAWWVRHGSSTPLRSRCVVIPLGKFWTPNGYRIAVSESIGVQNVQHMDILRWSFDGVLSPGGNVRIVKLFE